VTKGEQAGIVAVGVGLWVPALISAWRAASLRSDLNKKWRDRVDLMIGGLSEKAAKRLVDVQRLIRDFVVEGSVTFDPLRVVREPADLKAPMRRFLRILKVRDRTSRRYKRVLWVGPVLLTAATVYVVGVALAVLDISEIVDNRQMGWTGVVMGVLGALGILGGFVAYAYFEHMLSGAEILSQGDE
jgi:hypothetical protein